MKTYDYVLATSTSSLWCSPPEVQRYISDEQFKPVHLSLGREHGSLPDGEPVYMITYYEKEDQILVTVDVSGALKLVYCLEHLINLKY
jgi:hypothetical protein